MTLRARLLFAAVIAAGMAVTVVALRSAPMSALGLAFIGAAALTGILIVELSDVEAESVTFAIVVAALLTEGPALGVLVAAAGEIASAMRPPMPKAHRSAYNIGAHAIAAAATAFVAHALGMGTRTGIAPALAYAAPLSLLYFAISSGLVAWGIGWSAGSSIRRVWRGFRWLTPHYPALGAVGVLLAEGAKAAGILGVLVFCIPIAMSHYSVDIFVRRTKKQMEELEDANARLQAMNGALTETLASVVDARDLYLYRHSHHASDYTEKIARRLALSEEQIEHARQGALLHDIGKVGIPEGILRKPTGLDDAERDIMNSHAEIGAEIVARTKELEPVAAIVRAHHERWDGAGYPDGLAGRDIPIAARILAVLEAFDAMISDRPYRKAMGKTDAVAEVERCSGTQFDPEVVKAFLAVIRDEGTDWLVNSAADATVSGTDLFLPKGLARAHEHARHDDRDHQHAHEHIPVEKVG